MISYSPDDTFLLASALDNEITQFLALDGRRHSTFEVLPLCLCLLSPASPLLLTPILALFLQVPRTGLVSNFTRAYYSQSGAYVYTGQRRPIPTPL
jgi:hypothetical protein